MLEWSDRSSHEIAARPGYVAGREGVLIEELFAASIAALILACVAGWAISNTQARTPATVPIDPFTMMTSAKQMPTEHFADYSFVFD